jgi:hypothetical protein
MMLGFAAAARLREQSEEARKQEIRFFFMMSRTNLTIETGNRRGWKWDKAVVLVLRFLVFRIHEMA